MPGAFSAQKVQKTQGGEEKKILEGHFELRELA